MTADDSKTTSDRELLELAAKAIWPDDDEVSFWFDDSENAIVFIAADNQDHNGGDVSRVWNPLDDDGDALRLAAKLRLEISPLEGGCVEVARYDRDGRIAMAIEKSNDACADTRRAIVRAAAEIGAAL